MLVSARRSPIPYGLRFPTLTLYLILSFLYSWPFIYSVLFSFLFNTPRLPINYCDFIWCNEMPTSQPATNTGLHRCTMLHTYRHRNHSLLCWCVLGYRPVQRYDISWFWLMEPHWGTSVWCLEFKYVCINYTKIAFEVSILLHLFASLFCFVIFCLCSFELVFDDTSLRPEMINHGYNNGQLK